MLPSLEFNPWDPHCRNQLPLPQVLRLPQAAWHVYPRAHKVKKLNVIIKEVWLDMVVYAFNIRTQEAEAG